jgi:nucleoside-diphosphate-sugar epimerase
MGMKFLLIGGTGFIGVHVVRQLQKAGHEIAVFHRGHTPISLEGIRSFIGDRRTLADYKEAFRALAPDIVIDCILSSGRQAELLIETFRGIAGRLVALSSMDVYRAFGIFHGTEAGPLQPIPITEESELRQNLHPYPPAILKRVRGIFGWMDNEYDKIPVERAVLSQPDLPGTVLRLPMVYGPGDPLHRFFPVLKRLMDGRKQVLFFDQMAAWRSPRGYVENVATAIALAAQSHAASGQIYNLAEQPAFSELEWAQEIGKQFGWKGEFIVLPRERTPQHLIVPGNFAQFGAASSRRIREQLGFNDPVPLPEAIRRTIAWERANPPAEVHSEQFDYGAEDKAVAAYGEHLNTGVKG